MNPPSVHEHLLPEHDAEQGAGPGSIAGISEIYPTPSTIGDDDDGLREPLNPATAPDRLHSVDIARGVTIALMIFVNNADDTHPWWIPHAAWNGLHLADVVMPIFLVIVGVSVVLALARPRRLSRFRLLLKVLTRAAFLFLLGVAIQGSVPGRFATYDLYSVRIMGVLQRIAIAYLLVGLLVVANPPAEGAPAKGTLPWWVVGGVLFSLYVGASLLIRVPGCKNVRPAVQPDCNVAALLDTRILKPQHMYAHPSCSHAKPPCPIFDPEGLWATLGASCSAFIGLLYGYLLLRDDKTPQWRMGATAGAAAVMAGIGGLMVAARVPLNKNLYSGSYILITGGIAGALLVLCSVLDSLAAAAPVRVLIQPALWLGTNSLAVFVGDIVLQHMMENCFYWRDPDRTARVGLHELLQKVLPRRWGEPGANNVYAALDVLFWVVVAGVLWRKRIFWKL